MDSGMYSTLNDAAKSFVIFNAQNNYPKATGLSIWAPSDSATYQKWAAEYGGLKFESATQWSEALKYLVQ